MTTAIRSPSLTQHSRSAANPRPRRAPAVRLALLGCGNVGGAFARLVLDEHEAIERRTGVRLELAAALVRNPHRDRGIGRASFTDHADMLFAAKPDVIVETIGGTGPGVEPARTLVARALSRGIPVVSANKTLIAHHGFDLQRLARRAGTTLRHEAAVCAAIPVFDAMRQLRGEPVHRVLGIVNGTCNAILTRMEKTGCTLDAALAEAQRAGLAEPDPSADLSGRDSAEKLVILARALGWRRATVGDVEVRGIESVTPSDLLNASRRGCALRLIARLEARNNRPLLLRVEPSLIPRPHALATVISANNGLTIDTAWRGELFFRGRGAGPTPTAAALLGDVLRLVKPPRLRRRHTAGRAEERHAAYYLRLGPGFDPQSILTAFRTCGVELEHIECSREGCAIFTQEAPRPGVDRAIESLSPSPAIAAPRLP